MICMPSSRLSSQPLYQSPQVSATLCSATASVGVDFAIITDVLLRPLRIMLAFKIEVDILKLVEDSALMLLLVLFLLPEAA